MRMWVGAQGFRLYWYTRLWRCTDRARFSTLLIFLTKPYLQQELLEIL